MKILRINGAYFTEDNKYMIQKTSWGEWDVFKAYKPFYCEYQATFKYLKVAKEYVLSKYNN